MMRFFFPFLFLFFLLFPSLLLIEGKDSYPPISSLISPLRCSTCQSVLSSIIDYSNNLSFPPSNYRLKKNQKNYLTEDLLIDRLEQICDPSSDDNIGDWLLNTDIIINNNNGSIIIKLNNNDNNNNNIPDCRSKCITLSLACIETFNDGLIDIVELIFNEKKKSSNGIINPQQKQIIINNKICNNYCNSPLLSSIINPDDRIKINQLLINDNPPSLSEEEIKIKKMMSELEKAGMGKMDLMDSDMIKQARESMTDDEEKQLFEKMAAKKNRDIDDDDNDDDNMNDMGMDDDYMKNLLHDEL